MRSISIVIGRVITLVAAMAEREKHRSGVSLSVCLFFSSSSSSSAKAVVTRRLI